jgi:MFS transporter, DHA2 family, multidrug resistance protein
MNARQARDGLPPAQRLRAMLVIEIALAMSVLDGAIANIALPTIAAELSAEPATAIWMVNGYQLAVTVLLLPSASLGELHGYRRVYGVGLAVFTLGSLACALSDSVDSDSISNSPGFWQRWHHERQQRARAVCLSSRPPRPRHCD